MEVFGPGPRLVLLTNFFGMWQNLVSGARSTRLFQARRKARIVMRSAAIHARIEAVSRANGPRCRVVPEVRH